MYHPALHYHWYSQLQGGVRHQLEVCQGDGNYNPPEHMLLRTQKNKDVHLDEAWSAAKAVLDTGLKKGTKHYLQKAEEIHKESAELVEKLKKKQDALNTKKKKASDKPGHPIRESKRVKNLRPSYEPKFG